jgi:hypothetical protein
MNGQLDQALVLLARRISQCPGWAWEPGMGLLCGRVVVAVALDASFCAAPGMLLVTRPQARPPITETMTQARALPEPGSEGVQDALTRLVAQRHTDCQLHRRLVPGEAGGLIWRVVLTCPGRRSVVFESSLLADALVQAVVARRRGEAQRD